MRDRLARLAIVAAGLGGCPTSAIAQVPPDAGATALGLVALHIYTDLGYVGRPLRRNPVRVWVDVRAPVLRAILDPADAGAAPGYVLDGDGYERMIFGGVRAEADRTDWMRYRLGQLLDAAAGEHPLSAGQLRRLRLVGERDIEHFLERVEESRRRCEAVGREPGPRLDLLRGVGSARRTFNAGPFGEGSLLARTLAKIFADRDAAPDR